MYTKETPLSFLLLFIIALTSNLSSQTIIWSEDFESAGNEEYTSNASFANIVNLPEWKYSKTNNGRLRLAAGAGFYNGGSNAATLDVSPNGTYSVNSIIAEVDMSAYAVSTALELSFFYTHHGEESHSKDRVFVRGSNADTWVEIYDWYANRPSAGVFKHVTGLDIDAVLSGAGQSLTSTFQVKFSQKDNYGASSTTQDDGFTVDDIQIIEVSPPDCNWQLCLYDSYGDGWNGGTVEILVAGSSMGVLTLNNGLGPSCISIPIYIGDDIELDYTSGSYSSENAYFLFDSQGNMVYSSGDGASTPVDYTFSNADCNSHANTPNEQDCLGAISICGDTYSTTNSYEGTGNNVFEINGNSSCLASGERNDVWYTFTVQQDGDLMFTITPNTSTDDYDWAVFDLTNSSCSDIYSDPTIEVSCNYSGTSGDTGPDGSTSFSNQSDSGTPFNDGIPVLTGEVYVINVSNYSSTQDGYTIDFSMSSGVIIDVTPPELQTIINSPTCGQNQITAWFTELVDTLTVNAGDFTVTGPGGPYSITEVHGTSGVDRDREYELTLDAQLIAGGTYTLVFSGQVDDACGNTVTGNSLDFIVDGVSGSVVLDDSSVFCYDDANGTATASASGGSGTYSYLWSNASVSSSVNGLIAGAYTVTVSDDVGVCYDVVNFVINPSNASITVGTWTGVFDSDWTNCRNWGYGTIPLYSTDVTIPGGCSNYPIVPIDGLIKNAVGGACKSLRIQNGGALTMSAGHDLIIDGASVFVETGGTLTVTGDLTIQNTASLSLLGGNIFIAGDLTNNAIFTCSSGDVSLNGANMQIVGGNQISSFFNLTIDNGSTGITLGADIVVNNNLLMNNGDLNLATFDIDLGTTGTLLGENSSSRIKALDGMGIPLAGTITARRTNPSGNIAGLGLEVTPAAPLGNTTIKRGHEALQGTGSYSGNTSVLRYYDITASNTNRSVIVNDLVFNYFDNELNGHTDGTLIIFQEIQETYGGVPGPIFWHPLTSANSAAMNTTTATTSNNFLTTTRVTMGSDTKPLPIDLIEFNAFCRNDMVELSWKTASEKNNDYFTIEKSIDGKSFEEIAYVEGNGNSNKIISYMYTDFVLNDEIYYRLRQTDFDNKSSLSNVIKAKCKQNGFGNKKELLVYPNPVEKGDEVFIEVKGFEEETEILVVVLDVYGRMQYSKVILTQISNNTVIASDKLNRLPAGTYIIVGTSDDKIYRKKLIINK